MEAPESKDLRTPGRFYRPGTEDKAIFVLQRLEPPSFRICEPFEYVDHLGVVYTVPVDVDAASNETDLASIPPFLTWLVPRDGRHTPAALLHDALIGGIEGEEYATSTRQQVDDAHADYVFREAMRALEVPWLRRWLMWAAAAVRTASLTSDTPPRWRFGAVGLVGVASVLLALLSGLMALDVPDLGSVELPWLGDRPLYLEILFGLGQIVVSAAAFSVVLGAVFHSWRMVRVGLLGGATIGFFGLPMVASLVGAGGYLAVEWIISLSRPDKPESA